MIRIVSIVLISVFGLMALVGCRAEVGRTSGNIVSPR
jgi:hypothetical protein